MSDSREWLLPSQQYAFEGLTALDEAALYERRQLVFLVLSGLFLGTLAMLNILGVTRFLDLSFAIPGTVITIPMPLAVGALPYPVTFLCRLHLRALRAPLRQVTASMIAYLAAQFIDVQAFHFWKKLTSGRHLWLRNNGSTLVSQLVDTISVILITHYLAKGLPVEASKPLWPQLLTFMAAGYTYKLTVALLDTIPFYLGVKHLGRCLRIHPVHGAGWD